MRFDPVFFTNKFYRAENDASCGGDGGDEVALISHTGLVFLCEYLGLTVVGLLLNACFSKSHRT